jgi:hypothetical protein
MPEIAPGPVPRGLPETVFTDPETIRLISTAYIDEPALAPLSDDADGLDFLEQLESLTSRRQGLGMPLPAGLKRAELLSEASGYGWTFINAAFCYTRPAGNRFNDASRGAWYAAFGPLAIETAQAEVAFHLSRELENVGVFENVTAYRELVAGFTATMADLRSRPDEACLSPDPEIAYPEGQRLARELAAARIAGLLYPSARHEDGECLVAFRPNLVQNVRPGRKWVFTWTGSATPSIREG